MTMAGYSWEDECGSLCSRSVFGRAMPSTRGSRAVAASRHGSPSSVQLLCALFQRSSPIAPDEAASWNSGQSYRTERVAGHGTSAQLLTASSSFSRLTKWLTFDIHNITAQLFDRDACPFLPV